MAYLRILLFISLVSLTFALSKRPNGTLNMNLYCHKNFIIRFQTSNSFIHSAGKFYRVCIQSTHRILQHRSANLLLPWHGEIFFDNFPIDQHWAEFGQRWFRVVRRSYPANRYNTLRQSTLYIFVQLFEYSQKEADQPESVQSNVRRHWDGTPIQNLLAFDSNRFLEGDSTGHRTVDLLCGQSIQWNATVLLHHGNFVGNICIVAGCRLFSGQIVSQGKLNLNFNFFFVQIICLAIS